MLALSSLCGPRSILARAWTSTLALLAMLEQKAPHSSCSAGPLGAAEDSGMASRLNSTARQAIQAMCRRGGMERSGQESWWLL
ncbi:hypothetical protein D3C77_667360 [compost metagenome]